MPPASYNPQQTASYRRHPKQPQPGYALANHPPEPYPEEIEYARDYPAQPQNGSNSQRRRRSQSNPPAGNGQPPLPLQDASRGPPVAYKEPYMGSYAAPARSRSHKRYEPAPAAVRRSAQPNAQPQPFQMPPNSTEYQPSPTTPAASTPISPTTDYSERRRSSSGTAGAQRSRTGSVSHRSPLQKLEGALDDISKEERRARILEAEAAAQERRGSRHGPEQNAPAAVAQPRHASGPAQPGPQRTASGRRNFSLPTGGLVDSRQPEKANVEFTQPWQQAPRQEQGSQRRARVPQYDGPIDPQTKRTSQVDPDVTRSTSYRDRNVKVETTHARQDSHSRGNGAPMSAGAIGAAAGAGIGVAAAGNRGYQGQDQPAVGRSNSRKLQKRAQPEVYQQTSNRDAAVMPDLHKQPQSSRTGHAQGTRAATRYQPPDPLPAEAVRNPGPGPKYQVPPQTVNAQRAHDQIAFEREDAHLPSVAQQSHTHHLPNMFHRHHHEERRYTSSQPLDEWKTAEAASLTAEDLDIDSVETEADSKMPWWEKRNSQHRRSSGPGMAQVDGAYEEPAGQTHFTPPLYIKCGPLLRYCGMRREPRMGRSDKWVWRGSVMIVTIDQHSSYERRPTLRLFLQPKDLLPPPPAQLDESTGQKLASEYVDPLAGEIKMSRTGKTLYVKPVEDLDEEADLSRREDDSGLYEESKSATNHTSRIKKKDGEKCNKYREVKGVRLYAERGVTFWRFNLEIELGKDQARVAYRINKGPAIGFWVPARGETMNIMFHSCNGFSLSVNPHEFCGPDPLWRDVLNNHQTRPFHVMIGGGDQIYNDAATRQTNYFRDWLGTKNAMHKHSAEFTDDMQNELEEFYLNRYAMWFSQGFFGMANSQIPMINMWDDHDIIDGYGSYPHHFMRNAVFCGLGAVAFKYYMLFQHQSLPDETEIDEPSWLLGAAPGPYIDQLSRSVFMFLGKNVAFVGLDCRTERMRDEILSAETYYRIFDRCRKEIIEGDTKHLIVLLGVPIAYPRLNFLENVLTSRIMDPVKALGRTGMLGNFVNKFDGGVEILDDLDDHWTAKHHKAERNWFIQELQELAADKSVRITILGGDVHLAAVGQFYSNKKLGIPKDRDHRYMPNVISSAIVNTPPPELMGDILNKRNKVHHLDADTDEDMIPMFTHDVDGTFNRSTESYGQRQASIADPPRPNPFHRRPTGLSIKAARKGGAFDDDDPDNPDLSAINLECGLDVVLNLEVSQKDPAGITTPYRLLVPALFYDGPPDENVISEKRPSGSGLKNLFSIRRKKKKDFEDDEYYDSRSPSPTASEEAAIEELSQVGGYNGGGGEGGHPLPRDGRAARGGNGYNYGADGSQYPARGGGRYAPSTPTTTHPQADYPVQPRTIAPVMYDSPPRTNSMRQQQRQPPAVVQYGSEPIASNRRPLPPQPQGPLPPTAVDAATGDRRYAAQEMHTPPSVPREMSGARDGGGRRGSVRRDSRYYDDDELSDEDDSLGSFRSYGDKGQGAGKGAATGKKKKKWMVWR
ncbi:Metallo-dependent phosphatase [Lasiodiplodia theobromae]|uniref:Metallo-dependent phosphatase n=1 Tax=Lasiodiplodia theobromae TaxID=45133 RepID=UPI0015C3F389|nr:Metallo-dependent phosphatase [Lasiodiplodia theobromae]KAF4538436.1 Metallo-dependent phosphatase [Lasiodiplodia theobromae]